MRNLLELSWRLLRGGGRQAMLGTWLTAAAVAVSSALLLFAVAANVAFGARADREAWRHPVAAAGTPVAIEATSQDHVRDRIITIVDVAPLREAAGVRPPGMSRMPRPGEVWVSPGLAELMAGLPAKQLAERFPGKVAGTLGDDGLLYPGELVAVVGRTPADPAMTASRADQPLTTTSPTKIADFAGKAGDEITVYRIMALIASVLMVVPLLVFGGAAARLTVARRDQRLAALRLVGATPGQVVLMTVAEAVITAFGGAVLGLALYGAAAPLLGRIRMAGGSWFAADLWPGVLPVLGVLLAVPLLVGLSAVVGLRRVVVSPLGVARRQTPPAMRFVRVVALLAILAAVPAAFRNTSAAVVAIVLALAFLALNLVGPWVVGVIGRTTTRTARSPARLLAGRRLVDDPKSAWRTVSGVALTGFVAGFIGLLSPSSDLLGEPPATTGLRLTVPAAQAPALAGQAEDRLAGAGIDARVEVSGSSGDSGDSGRRMLTITLPPAAGAARTDTARTALAGLVPGRIATSPVDERVLGDQLLDDVRTGTLIVLGVSFLVAIASAGITAASSVLDRRQAYALLHLAGTPLEVLDRARRAETLVPLAVMGGGSIVTGMFCALPFVPAVMNVTGALTLLVTVAVGFAGVVGAGALSRPLLRSVTANPAPRPD
ncbi:ABC transporter permease [Sphaerisporangium sp. TRM90804]|uniref:ABC transporter permease n=1 Tax=Sphaerisporangium sp. TRM90804 TaxID=3031113 RepID=UPI0024482DC9|nr:ABC transporter permease [Sphaerisporangium sp. TRM90804]MDH2425328.1 ABC transporter permease [Sphaerisporangium sp. TRM90804]